MPWALEPYRQRNREREIYSTGTRALVERARQVGIGLSIVEAYELIRDAHGNFNDALEQLTVGARNAGLRDRVDRLINIGGQPYQEEQPPAKIPRIEEGDVTMQSGVSNYAQTGYSKKVLGRYKKRKLWKDVAKYVRGMQNNVIGRCQDLLCPRPTAASLLSKPLSFCLDQTNTLLLMPCYCFNLSLPPFHANDNGLAYINPMYRLSKNLSQLPASRAWTWIEQPMQNNAASGNLKQSDLPGYSASQWQIEHTERGIGSYNSYQHNWSDIRLLFQGSVQYPTRFHVYTCTFPFDGVGPVRVTSASGVFVQDTNPTDADDIAEADYFWERMMFPKVVHPFAVTKKTGLHHKHMNVISHEVINIGCENSNGQDLQPMQYIKRIFYRNGKVYDNYRASTTESSFMELTVPAARSGLRDTQYVGYADNDVQDGATSLPSREKDVWLVIIAENYVKTTGTRVGWTSGTPTTAPYTWTETGTVSNTPSFDLSVRGKYVMYMDDSTDRA